MDVLSFGVRNVVEVIGALGLAERLDLFGGAMLAAEMGARKSNLLNNLVCNMLCSLKTPFSSCVLRGLGGKLS